MDLRASIFSGKNRTAAAIAAVAVVLCLAVVYWAAGRYASVSRTASARRADFAKYRAVEEEYLKKKAFVDIKARKAYASDVSESTVAAMERIGARVGAKEAFTAIKPLEEKEAAGYTERGVEVRLERIDLNRLVNLLYLLENNRGLFVIREFSMKARFEDPNLMDCSMKVVHLLKRKTAGP